MIYCVTKRETYIQLLREPDIACYPINAKKDVLIKFIDECGKHWYWFEMCEENGVAF